MMYNNNTYMPPQQPQYQPQPQVHMTTMTTTTSTMMGGSSNLGKQILAAIKALTQLKSTNNVASMSCSDAANILSCFGFDNDKMKALELIAGQIYDRMQNAETVVSKFGFSNDQNKARQVLMK
ncbi:hypothetical protein FDP41_010185 [Naegleria fowleri]|uniref:DUF4476 domain-containing protein n=1 Tax=Naegleria fowleri TaxID=5763 RepID=A0A6A5BEM6_NAEFO|nr:uncharacterized protein FDP41_010185 [Naegleria fowleri]KAF0971509.1 hypothetical protein FDP41_010185 [Naegleria fowleri]